MFVHSICLTCSASAATVLLYTRSYILTSHNGTVFTPEYKQLLIINIRSGEKQMLVPDTRLRLVRKNSSIKKKAVSHLSEWGGAPWGWRCRGISCRTCRKREPRCPKTKGNSSSIQSYNWHLCVVQNTPTLKYLSDLVQRHWCRDRTFYNVSNVMLNLIDNFDVGEFRWSHLMCKRWHFFTVSRLLDKT